MFYTPKYGVLTSENEGFGFPWHVVNSWNTTLRFCLSWLAKLNFIFPEMLTQNSWRIWWDRIRKKKHHQPNRSIQVVGTKKKGVSLGNTPLTMRLHIPWQNPKSKSRRCSLHFILPPLRFTAPYNSLVFPPQDKMQRPWLHLLMPRPHLTNNQAHWHHVHCLHSSWFLAWHPVLGKYTTDGRNLAITT